jgi:hypothetical protein
MAAANGRWPLGLKLLCPGGQFRPVLVRQRQIVSGQRKFFETDEM